MVGSNAEGLKNVTRLLVPTTDLLAEYHEHVWCAVAGLVPFTNSPQLPYPGIYVGSSFNLGVERYRYPQDLPKVDAKSGQVVLPGARPAERAVRIPAAVPGRRRRNQPVQVR